MAAKLTFFASLAAGAITSAPPTLLTDDWARTRVDGAWRFSEIFDAMKVGGTDGPEFDVARPELV